MRAITYPKIMKEYLEKKFKNKKILILGFAREGQSSFRLLRKYFPDQQISIADQNEVEVDTEINIQKYFGKDYLDDLSEFNIVVKSPGISGLKPEILEAQKNGVEITSQTKLFFDVCQGTVIGITGTKGKSTTSSLIYEILKKSGFNVSLVGNIGSPVLDSLEDDSSKKYYVFELSSHQLFDLPKSPHIAVVTNVAVDHLDWYGNFENYVDAKSHILKFQKDGDIAILNYDNLITREFDRFTKGKVFFTSKEIKAEGAYVDNGVIFLNIDGHSEVLGDTKDLTLVGKHNWDNVMMAALVAKNLCVKNEDIWMAVSGFKQLEHHLEFVKTVNEVSFYDDSFAVDQIATSAAINAFDKEITLILGGFDRGIDYTGISEEISKKTNIKTIVVIGQITEKIIKFLRKANYSGKIIKLDRTKMDKIVETAYKSCSPGGIVLFSPAAASFDMFKDYKDRGEQFKKAVLKL